MVSTARIKHKKTHKASPLPEHFHPLDMKDNKVSVNEDRGVIEIIGYYLEVKVRGQVASLTEDQLRDKFETLIRRTNIGDGMQGIKVSELTRIYKAGSSVTAEEKKNAVLKLGG